MSETEGQAQGGTGTNRQVSSGGRSADATTVAVAARGQQEQALLAALRRGDEEAFARLVEAYTASLLRLATLYVYSRAVAEDVVQETWVGVLGGLDRFEGRSALKTWIFRILVNIAKTRAQREARSIPFSAFGAPTTQDGDGDEPAVELEHFVVPEGKAGRGYWSAAPASWEAAPEERLLALEARERIEQAIATLPPAQREVITLRDVEGWASDEVCNLLGISETNQRVLLHRARSRVRRALDAYLGEK